MLMNISPELSQKYLALAVEWFISFAPKVVLAAAVLFVGLFVVKRLSRMINKVFEKSGLDQEISEFLHSLVEVGLKIIVALIAASIIGVKMTALIGLLAAAGFAVGLALQGFLGNFAAGLTILFFKPYRIGDWIQVSDHFGKVQSIQIFNTALTTPNDKTLIIPNGQITDNIITNYSTIGKMRLELEVTMPYSEDFTRVKKIIANALKDLSIIDHEREPMIGIESYDSHSIIISVRPYIDPDNYWEATYASYAAIKKAFNDNNVQVAYSEGVELGEIGG